MSCAFAFIFQIFTPGPVPFIGTGMFSGSWNRPSYSKVAKTGQGQGDGGGGGRVQGDVVRDGGGNIVDNMEAINRDATDLLRNDRRGQQATAKFLFKERLDMEQKRKILAKGNIVTFLFQSPVPDKRSHMNLILRTAGFKTSDIESLKLNEFRNNQAEILFKKSVSIDVEKIERILRNNQLDVAVSKFDNSEEIMMVYGLPLSDDLREIEKHIRDAILPFVGEIKEVIATKHSAGPPGREDDFFKDCYDGNFKVKVVPLKNGTYVPNVIVVGKDAKACGKVVYTKSLSPKKQMCLNCYSLDHIKTDPECKGPVKWDDYVRDFERIIKEARKEVAEENKEQGVVRTSEETRVSMYLREADEMDNIKQQLEFKEKQLEGLQEIITRLEKKIASGGYEEESEEEEGENDSSENGMDDEYSEANEEVLSENNDGEVEDGQVSESLVENHGSSGNVLSDDDDPLSTSKNVELENDKGSKRPSSSPPHQERLSKQGNLGIEKGKIYSFIQGEDGKKVTGKVKLKTSQTVIVEDDEDVEHELDLTTCVHFYLEEGNDDFEN